MYTTSPLGLPTICNHGCSINIEGLFPFAVSREIYLLHNEMVHKIAQFEEGLRVMKLYLRGQNSLRSCQKGQPLRSCSTRQECSDLENKVCAFACLYVALPSWACKPVPEVDSQVQFRCFFVYKLNTCSGKGPTDSASTSVHCLRAYKCSAVETSI